MVLGLPMVSGWVRVLPIYKSLLYDLCRIITWKILPKVELRVDEESQTR